jgi:hypothetical protein
VDWVRLAGNLIACNLRCDPRRENKVLVPILFLIACNLRYDPWCENKVLVPILFLIGGFHFDHL